MIDFYCLRFCMIPLCLDTKRIKKIKHIYLKELTLGQPVALGLPQNILIPRVI